MVPARWFIGISSPSGGQGVSAALLETAGVGLDLRAHVIQTIHHPYGGDLRELLHRLAGPGLVELRQLGQLHRVLGETFAVAARQVADRASFSLRNVSCVAVPGHTVWHDAASRLSASLAMGMSAVVAERTGVTTLGDLRARDLAAGGQGVALTALADSVLFGTPHENRLLVHLGGVARVVLLPAAARLAAVRGFEAGPCNVLLDALMRQLSGGREPCDSGGKHAVQGRALEPLLHSWLSHSCLQRLPPRHIPRETFDDSFARQAIEHARLLGAEPHDLLCTATHFIARTIADSVRRFLPSAGQIHRVMLSGGGARNGFLWQLLQQQWADWPLERTDSYGIPADAHEAAAYGVLAALVIDGVPSNLPALTGAAGCRLLGSLTPGSSVNWARCLAWMAAQTASLAVPEADEAA